jgi:MFS family permease
LAFGFGTAYPGLQMIVAKITPPYRLGLALSTFFIFLDAGLGFGGYIIGYIAERIGFQNMFLTMAAVVLCIMPLYYLAHGRKVRKAQKSGRSASQSA